EAFSSSSVSANGAGSTAYGETNASIEYCNAENGEEENNNVVPAQFDLEPVPFGCSASATNEVIADGESADADGYARAEIYDCNTGFGIVGGSNEVNASLFDEEDLDELLAGGCAAESTVIAEALGDNTNAYA